MTNIASNKLAYLEKNTFQPKVTHNFLTRPELDLNSGSAKRQRPISSSVLDHSDIGAGPLIELVCGIACGVLVRLGMDDCPDTFGQRAALELTDSQ